MCTHEDLLTLRTTSKRIKRVLMNVPARYRPLSSHAVSLECHLMNPLHNFVRIIGCEKGNVDEHKLTTLPPSVLKVVYHGYTSYYHTLKWPSTVRETELHVSTDQPVLSFPETLHTLTFCHDWNRSVHEWQLPNDLVSLRFNELFNQPITGLKLPNTLQTLHLGENFNQQVNGWDLPDSLREIVLSDSFDQPIDAWKLPSNLQTLTFGNKFCRKTYYL